MTQSIAISSYQSTCVCLQLQEHQLSFIVLREEKKKAVPREVGVSYDGVKKKGKQARQAGETLILYYDFACVASDAQTP